MPLLICYNSCACHCSYVLIFVFAIIPFVTFLTLVIIQPLLCGIPKKLIIFFCFIILLAPLIVFCFYILTPNLFQVILSLFCCYKMDFNWDVAYYESEKKIQSFFQSIFNYNDPNVLKKWLGMVMVGLYLNQLVNWLEEKN
jgi:hypothetical protein